MHGTEVRNVLHNDYLGLRESEVVDLSGLAKGYEYFSDNGGC